MKKILIYPWAALRILYLTLYELYCVYYLYNVIKEEVVKPHPKMLDPAKIITK